MSEYTRSGCCPKCGSGDDWTGHVCYKCGYSIYETDLMPFTCEQIRDICRFMVFISENGGHGEIVLKVRENKIKFINLGDIGRKYEALSE